MEFGFGNLDIRNISKLFDEVDPNRHTSNDSDSDLDDATPTHKSCAKGPGDIASTSKPAPTPDAQSKQLLPDRKGIWAPTEVASNGDGSFENDNISITNDPRRTPKHEMHYRQSVTTEDIYLQMGNKTPGTASCEDLVVEIHLPEDDFQKMQLNLKKQAIDLRSPIHFLYLNLPHPIDPRVGNAKWDRDTEKLSITVKLSREFDEFNF